MTWYVKVYDIFLTNYMYSVLWTCFMWSQYSHGNVHKYYLTWNLSSFRIDHYAYFPPRVGSRTIMFSLWRKHYDHCLIIIYFYFHSMDGPVANKALFTFFSCSSQWGAVTLRFTFTPYWISFINSPLLPFPNGHLSNLLGILFSNISCSYSYTKKKCPHNCVPNLTVVLGSVSSIISFLMACLGVHINPLYWWYLILHRNIFLYLQNEVYIKIP
jgi:hypothetical protein